MSEVEQELTDEQHTEAVAEVEAAQAQRKSERALRHIVEMWVAMGNTDAWDQMMKQLDVEAQEYRARRFQQIMDGEEINQREIDYERGLIAGLARPAIIMATARRKLERIDTSEPETTEEARYW